MKKIIAFMFLLVVCGTGYAVATSADIFLRSDYDYFVVDSECDVIVQWNGMPTPPDLYWNIQLSYFENDNWVVVEEFTTGNYSNTTGIRYLPLFLPGFNWKYSNIQAKIRARCYYTTNNPNLPWQLYTEHDIYFMVAAN